MLERSHERFRTTSWSRIQSIKDPDEAQQRVALQELVEIYWPAVYAFLRRQRHNRDAAAELTQAFFSDVVVGRSLFERAEACSGRLRTLLLRALRNYCIDRVRRDRPWAAPVSLPMHLEEEEAKLRSISDTDSGTAFERRWALSLFEEALRRCEAHFLRTGRGGHWTLFEQRVLVPAATGNSPPPYATDSAAHALGTSAKAAAAVQVVKRRFVALLREVVAETVENPADVDQEVRNVRSMMYAQ